MHITFSQTTGNDNARQSELPLRDDTAFTGDGVLDMTTLNYLHEAAILYNLRTRFLAAQPYTYTGDICIAVNPYQWLDLYTESTRKEYFIFGRTELPPHAYATSAAAFNGVQEGGPNQSILVSGESGAGKTETVSPHSPICYASLADAPFSVFLRGVRFSGKNIDGTCGLHRSWGRPNSYSSYFRIQPTS